MIKRYVSNCLVLVGWLAVLLVIGGCQDPESRLAQHIETGDAYYADSNYDKARVEYLNALQIDPNHSQARYRAGDALQALGDLRQAAGHYLAAVDFDPMHLDARVALAKLYLLSGQLDAATRLVEEALELEPNSADALAMSAGLDAQMGNADQAVERARRSLSLDPANEAAVSLLSSIYMRRSEPALAHGVLTRALEANSDSVGIRAVYAQVLLEDRRWDDAAVQLREVLAIEPDDPAHYERLAEVLTLAGRVEEVEALLAGKAATESGAADFRLLHVSWQANRDSDVAVSLLQRYSSQDPESNALRLALASVYEQRGELSEAQAQLDAIIAQSRQDQMLLDAQLAKVRLALAKADSPAADAALKAAREISASDTKVMAMASRIAMEREDFDIAVANLRTALRDKPNSEPLLLALAEAYRRSGQLDLMLDSLQSAEQVAADTPAIARALFVEYERRQQFDQALVVAKKLSRLLPTSSYGLEAEFKAYVGLAQWDAALATATTLAERFPESSVGPFLQGTVHQTKDNLVAARASFKRALEVQPGTVEPVAALVRSYLSNDQPVEAERLLAQQLEHNASNPVFHNLQAEVLFAQGQFDRSVAAFQKSMELKPDWWIPYRGLAALRAKQGALDDAEAILQQGVAASGAARLYIDYALLLQSQSRMDELEALYDAALQVHPENTTLRNNYAVHLSERNTPQALERAQALASNFRSYSDPALLDTLGWIQFQLDDLEAADATFRQALASAPQVPILNYHYARVLERLGRKEEARARVTVALQSDSFAKKDDAQALLTRMDRAQAG